VSNSKQPSPPLQTEKQLKQPIVLPEAPQKIPKQVLADKANSDFIKEISNQQNTTELPTNPASSAKHKRVPKPNPVINLPKVTVIFRSNIFSSLCSYDALNAAQNALVNT